MGRGTGIQLLDGARPAADLNWSRLGRAFKILVRVRRRLRVEEAGRKHDGQRLHGGNGR